MADHDDDDDYPDDLDDGYGEPVGSCEGLPPAPIRDGVRYGQVANLSNYCFGTDGSVWSCRNARWGRRAFWYEMSTPLSDGYPCVKLTMDDRTQRIFRVHHLTLTAFVGSRPDGLLGLHRDGDRANGSLGNLYWGTHSDNVKDSIHHGTFRTPFTTASRRNRPKRFTQEEVGEMVSMKETGSTLREIAEKYGLSFGYAGHLIRCANATKAATT